MRVPHEVARIIHAVLPLALVAGGYVYATDPRAWLTAFAELFVCIAGGVLSLAGLVDLLLHVVPCGRRLQAHKTEPRMRLAEAFETTRAAWVFSAFAAWPRYL